MRCCGSSALRTGRYTSPHLESVIERICVDNEPLSAERFAEVFDEVAPFAELVDGGMQTGSRSSSC